MLIGMILDKPFPPDVRVEKEAKALIDAGHKVHLLVFMRHRDKGEPEEEINGVKVHRVPHPRGKMSSLGNRWNSIKLQTTFVNPYWAKTIELNARKFKWTVLHAHDLQLVGSALSAGKKLGIPVVADLHENKPDQYLAKRASSPFFKRIKHAIRRNIFIWRLYERTALQQCDRVIVVVREMAERLYPYGIPESKIVIVSNTEDASVFQENELDQEVLDRYRNDWVVSYIGGLAPYKGFSTLMRALPLAAPDIPNLKCVIVGAKRQEYVERYTKLAMQYGCDKWVDILEWVPFKKVRSFMAASAAGILPLDNFEQNQSVSSHKLFQYMISGIPIIVSNMRSLKRLIEETGAGLVFEAGDPSSLARVLVDLYKNPGLRDRLGRNGYEAARGLYAWRNDAARLVSLYDELNGEKTQDGTRNKY
jgi:glycosyltransferase involved in cell wall biosynthesis